MKFVASSLEIVAILRETVKDFFKDDCMRMAAALSYYAVFSFPPLLFLLIAILGCFFQSEDIRLEVSRNMANVIGKENAGIFDSLLKAANEMEPGIAGSVVGLCLLSVGASALMSELQSALNKIWQVKSSAEENGIGNFLLKKLLSLSMLLIVASLLVFSLIFNAVLSAFGERINAWFDSDILFQALRAIHFFASFVMLAVLFALTFKLSPQASMRWKDAWLGAIVTTLLFGLGNYAVGIYLGHSNPASAYGAAASLGAILIWIYYASMIVLFGAEFTCVWARARKPKQNPCA
jgi:membrane protein